MRTRLPAGRGVIATLFALFLAACGTYSTHTDPIFRGVIGPAGGTVAAGPVTLVIAPGALLTDLSVVILPQPDPLPIDPAAGDVDYLPGLHCIGPVGQGLAQPCVVRICYDPADVPPGATLADLVLLEWDEAAQLMRVRASATHDTTTNCFEDTFYGELGHIGVGVRTLQFDFVVAAAPLVGGAGGRGANDLFLCDSGGGASPVVVPNTADAFSYIASGDGRYVSFLRSDSQAETNAIFAVDVLDGTEVFASDPDLSVLSRDSLHGWFPGQPTNLFYTHEFASKGFQHILADADIGGAAHENLRDGDFEVSLIDVRISPDGTMAILRWEDFFEGGQFIDVVSTSTGALLGGDLPVLPNGFQSPMPRWLPDSSGITFVDGVLLRRIDRDGDNLATLWTAPSPLLDAAVADGFVATNPGVARVAYVRTTGFQISPAGGNQFPTTFFGTDVLAGGAAVEQDLGGIYGLAELAWHPDGATVWCQLTQFSQLIDGGFGAVIEPPPFAIEFLVAFDAATAATNRVINAVFGAMDVDKVSGRVLLWMESASQDEQFPASGVWLLDADGTGGTSVSLGNLVPIEAPRFLVSWRSGVCGSFGSLVR